MVELNSVCERAAENDWAGMSKDRSFSLKKRSRKKPGIRVSTLSPRPEHGEKRTVQKNPHKTRQGSSSILMPVDKKKYEFPQRSARCEEHIRAHQKCPVDCSRRRCQQHAKAMQDCPPGCEVREQELTEYRAFVKQQQMELAAEV